MDPPYRRRNVSESSLASAKDELEDEKKDGGRSAEDPEAVTEYRMRKIKNI